MQLSASGNACGRENVSNGERWSSPGLEIMSRMTSWGVLLTGAPGAGKSSVLEKLATLLEVEGVEFGALESEQLGWGSPWLSGEPWLGQLRAVLELQRGAGRRRFLIAATTETSDELAAVRDAIALDRLVAVLLVVAPEVAAARIDMREPDGWPGKQGLIGHARHLAVSMRDLAGIDIRIDTNARDAGDVAVELREALRPHGL
jgi:hypothetical protein